MQEPRLQTDKETVDTAFRFQNVMDNIDRSSPVILVGIHQAQDHVTWLARYARQNTGNRGGRNCENSECAGGQCGEQNIFLFAIPPASQTSYNLQGTTIFNMGPIIVPLDSSAAYESLVIKSNDTFFVTVYGTCFRIMGVMPLPKETTPSFFSIL